MQIYRNRRKSERRPRLCRRLGIRLLVYGLLLFSTPPFLSAAVFQIPAGDVPALIAALNTANANGEENTIFLEGATYILTMVNNTTGNCANGLPIITGAVTLHGLGTDQTTIARDPAAPGFCILSVAVGGSLTLDGLTIRGGNEGIFSFGTVIIANSTLAGNSSEAIRNLGDMSINTSTIADNSGTGINSDGNLTVINSTIAGNGGRGISNSGRMTITNSTIAGNEGGGIDNFEASMTITNSTIAGNSAGNSIGAGILSGHSSVAVTNSTIAGNRGRGGVGAPVGTLTGAITLQSSILALNIDASTGLPSNCFNITIAASSSSNNLIDDPTGCGFDASDRLGDPGLGDFIDDGAPGHGRFPLLPDSQAIDGGNDAACPATDQLGTPRNGTCDIGAVEFYPVINNLVALVNLTTAFDPIPVSNGPAGVFHITAEFTNTSSQAIANAFAEVVELTGGNLLLNADGGAGGVGARAILPNSATTPFEPGANSTFEFVIGLQQRERFTFFVNVLGGPQTSNLSVSRR